MFGICDIINRLRHNRGYGVQSPAAFFFVMHVLRTKLPYYIYPTLDKVSEETAGSSSAHCRRLFRITNYLRPTNIIIFDSSDSASQCAVATGKRGVPCHIISCTGEDSPTAEKVLKERGVCHTDGNSIDSLKDILQKEKEIGLLYIGCSERAEEIFKESLPYTNKLSAIIIEGIHRNKRALSQWERVRKSSNCIVTFDLYSMGILLFDTEYRKQHYTLNYK
ncbi:MAG: hypothetical protein IKV17_01415 [Bacteroidaceae bacterium]|nr:hypothetical protein [Bacteroidaceae bacterium]